MGSAEPTRVDPRLLGLRHLTILDDPRRDGVVIFGGASPHTAAEPFVVARAEIRGVEDVLDRMAWLACRGWRATPGDLVELARLLSSSLDAGD